MLTSLWVVAATCTAFLPMRWQMGPGLVLLVVAPGLILALGWSFGPWIAVAALAGFGSMFRHPLTYLARRARDARRNGRPVDE